MLYYFRGAKRNAELRESILEVKIAPHVAH